MLTLEETRVSLTPSEISSAKELLGRKPNAVELSMIDVMWSEHCSYKSSRALLKLLPTRSPRVVVGPGYDAGVVDIGDGYVVAFKLESHNHPSAIEPYNGAATGVGGIVRDILSMGCRPVALLDALRFGPLTSGHGRWLLQNVVKGIADYGNRIGVPTVGGELEFDSSFDSNCLVNVACLGIGRREDVRLPRFEKVGDIVILAGGSTGRDGIHGVTFASRTISERSEEDRPAVQIADAFTEKLVIESVLEADRTGYVHAVKDLGGGGLTCASSEMAYKGSRGVEIDLGKIHVREKGMIPSEILLSESQERMLLAVDPEGVRIVEDIFKKYGLSYSIIGRVTDAGKVEAILDSQKVVELPSKILADAPTINREAEEPHYLDELRNALVPAQYPDLSDVLAKVIECDSIASKEYVYRQYDHEVGIRTVLKPGDGDAAVLRLLETDKAVSFSAECNSKHSYLDPYNGCAGAVALGVQNAVAVGADPLAIADGCNFGSPEKPEVFWQFTKSIQGMQYMLSNLGLPCVGGNVSFYNEEEQTHRTIKPTVIVVTLGLIEQLEWVTTMAFKSGDDTIIAVGATFPELGGSEYLSELFGIEGGQPPIADALRVKASAEAVKASVREGLTTAVHDCSKGGLAAAISLMSIRGSLGAKVDIGKLPAVGISRLDELLFSESYARFILTAPSNSAAQILEIARKHGTPAAIIGRTGGDEVMFKRGRKIIAHDSIAMLGEKWRNRIHQRVSP